MPGALRFIFSVLLAHVAFPPAAAQENARGTWRATNNDCFIQAFGLGDRGMASVRYSNGVAEQGAVDVGERGVSLR